MSFAHALFELTQEQNLWQALPGQLHALASAVEVSPELPVFFRQPGLSDADKTARLSGVLADVVHPIVVQFAAQLMAQQRLNELPAIVVQYQQLLDKAQKVLPATVKTTVPMTDDQQYRLVETLKQMTGMSDIRLTRQVDPDILGGVMLTLQDLVIDGSLSGKLSQLRKQWC
jgi:F-type H+-transporting ATPase subunit delta